MAVEPLPKSRGIGARHARCERLSRSPTQLLSRTPPFTTVRSTCREAALGDSHIALMKIDFDRTQYQCPGCDFDEHLVAVVLQDERTCGHCCPQVVGIMGNACHQGRPRVALDRCDDCRQAQPGYESAVDGYR